MKKFLLALIIALMPCAAAAQSSAGLAFGQVPTAAQWNALFASKMDYLGSPAFTVAGGTFTGKVGFANSTLSAAGMNCGVGATPTMPVNGDIWCTSVGMFVRINGVTIALGAGGGTLTVPNGGTGQTTFTANLPILGNGAGALAQGTRSGTTTSFATTTGTLTSGNCVSIDGSGNFVAAGGPCTTGGGGGTVASSTIGQIAAYTGTTTVTGLATCNNGYVGTDGSGVNLCRTSLNATLSGTITALGTVATGVWQGTLVSPTFGGTGANNGAFTSTLAGNFATSGAAITLTAIGATNITLPTSGIIPNSNGTSGGIPYYNTSTTIASSATLGANLPVFGGGAGAAPISGTRTGSTTQVATYTGSAPTSTHCAQWDASGNLTDSGAVCAGATGGSVLLLTLTASGSTVLTDVGSSCGANGCFTNAYQSYTLTFINLVATTPGNSVSCQIQVYEGGSFQTAGYLSVGATADIPCFPSGTGSSTGAAPGVNGFITVSNPSASAKAAWIGLFGGVNSGSSVQAFNQYGQWNTSGVVTGFRAFFGTTAGTPTSSGIASGTIKVYGNP